MSNNFSAVNNDASKIAKAKKVLMQYWPLQAFIATNPLWELIDNDFFFVVTQNNINALMSVDYYFQKYNENQIAIPCVKLALVLIDHKELSDSDVASWIEKSFLSHEIAKENAILFSQQHEEYKFQKTTEWIREQIFILLRDYFGLGIYKTSSLLNYICSKAFSYSIILTNNNYSLNTTISDLLNQLGVCEDLAEQYLVTVYMQVYGWASFMNWRNQHQDNPWIPGEDACELILIIWLSLEVKISSETGLEYKNKCLKQVESNRAIFKALYIWQTAFELSYISQLEGKLNAKFLKPTEGLDKANYSAQFIFCIDTRSEGFRYFLEQESNGKFETFGFAGFFGAIFNLNNNGKISYQAPALVKASNTACVKLSKTVNRSFARQYFSKIKAIIHFGKNQLTAPFALFEIIGILFLPFMLFKSLRPKFKFSLFNNAMITLEHDFSEQEQLNSAYNLLTSIGLTKKFSEYVFLCAHKAHTTNNPYEASLNCGACGGNSGVPNALLMCEILNNKSIRLALTKKNILIPSHTQFIPACHYTSNDRLEILNSKVPAEIVKIITSAASKLRQDKKTRLPGVNSLSNRESNWSELIPELGLIDNAAIIIGPRALSKNYNLSQRCFLHSYEPSLDPHGDILTSILSAPAIVAHWISSQYYFSTTNPEQFGAGNKAIHNVLPNIGVLEGNLSDLKIGLPLQSTYNQGKPLHEPRRIAVFVYADTILLNKAIENSPDFKKLLDNHWIYLRHLKAS